MSALLTECSRRAELLQIATRHIARGGTDVAAAALISVPVTTLRDWLASLDRAEARLRRRFLSQHQTQPINASL